MRCPRQLKDEDGKISADERKTQHVRPQCTSLLDVIDKAVIWWVPGQLDRMENMICSRGNTRQGALESTSERDVTKMDWLAHQELDMTFGACVCQNTIPLPHLGLCFSVFIAHGVIV